jgi:hypothetical protein
MTINLELDKPTALGLMKLLRDIEDLETLEERNLDDDEVEGLRELLEHLVEIL